MAAIETRRLAANFAKPLVSLSLLFPFHFPARRRACRPIRFQHARRKEAFGPPPFGGCPKRRERIIVIRLVLLRCTVCAVSIDVEFSTAPVSRLVPPRHLVTWALALLHRIWPVAGLGFAVIVNMAWIGFLGFEFVKLMKLAFS